MTEYSKDTVVDINNLSRSFGDETALNDISLTINKGQVFGIVGENGAGKTTLIKHILGMYRAQQGSVKVMGKDPVQAPEEVLSKIGYLSEEPNMPGWMTIVELMNYSSAFYPTWDNDYANELIEVFNLDPKKKISELSKGQKARVGLCTAQAHRPELLLLDEPSSGLDPNVRRDILSAIIRTVVDEGRTVIFSSHLLEEVERVSDHLMMLSHGNLLLSEPMDDVLEKHLRIVTKGFSKVQQVIELPGYVNHKTNEEEVIIDLYGNLDEIIQEITNQGTEIISHRRMSLNDIFLTHSNPVK